MIPVYGFPIVEKQYTIEETRKEEEYVHSLATQVRFFG